MQAHDIDAFLERRLLVNYRVDPEVAARLLPHPFVPRLTKGWAIAGVCLIHLRKTRTRNLPAVFGIDVQGSAHRLAVMWPDRGGEMQPGVYISRRDSGSRLVGLIGRRSLAEHPATFVVSDFGDSISIDVTSRDEEGSVSVRAVAAQGLDSSVFDTMASGREFFEHGGPGFTQIRPGLFKGVALIAKSWEMDALRLNDVRSAWLSNHALFPAGTAVPDGAFVMRRTETKWRSVPDLTWPPDVVRPHRLAPLTIDSGGRHIQ